MTIIFVVYADNAVAAYTILNPFVLEKCVSIYNPTIITFLGNLIAGSIGAHQEEFFADEDAELKKNADIKF